MRFGSQNGSQNGERKNGVSGKRRPALTSLLKKKKTSEAGRRFAETRFFSLAIFQAILSRISSIRRPFFRCAARRFPLVATLCYYAITRIAHTRISVWDALRGRRSAGRRARPSARAQRTTRLLRESRTRGFRSWMRSGVGAPPGVAHARRGVRLILRPRREMFEGVVWWRFEVRLASDNTQNEVDFLALWGWG
jgi:hypothetical protein